MDYLKIFIPATVANVSCGFDSLGFAVETVGDEMTFTKTAEKGVKIQSDAMPSDLMGDKEALDLVRSYYAIPENQRRRLFDLARVLSDVA